MASASSASQARSWASASSPTMIVQARRSSPVLAQRLEGALVGRTREELVAVDQVEQRHRLAAQGVDDVAVVDDVTALAVRHRLAAPQRQRRASRRGSIRAGRREMRTRRRWPISRDGTV